MKRTKVMVLVVVAFVAMSGEALAAKRSSKAKLQIAGVVNLNTATPQQLDLLPGVGEKAAKRIVEHRAKTPFSRPEELVKVKGFGKKRFEKLKPYLAVSGQTTLHPVRASVTTPEAPKVLPAAQGRSAPKP